MEDHDQDYESAFDEFADGTDAASETTFDAPEDTFDAPEDMPEEASSDPIEAPETAPEIDYKAEAERLRAQAQQWEHKYNSDLGRQRALQTKIAELEGQLKQHTTKAREDYSAKEWAELQEDFPEIAKAIDAKFKAQQELHNREVRALREQLAPIQQNAREQQRAAQFHILESHHPDWRDVVKSNDFQSWLGNQPAVIKNLMNSEEAAEAAYLLNTFKLANGGIDTSEVKRKRESQLRQAQTVPNRGSRSRSALPAEDDFEAAFDYYASQG